MQTLICKRHIIYETWKLKIVIERDAQYDEFSKICITIYGNVYSISVVRTRYSVCLMDPDQWFSYTATTTDALDKMYLLAQFFFQTELCELREKVTEAGSEKFKTEARIKHLEQEVHEKTEEIQKLKADVEEVPLWYAYQSSQMSKITNP